MNSVYRPTKYDVVAVKAASLAGGGMYPLQAWQSAAMEVFPDNLASQAKGCPKSAFLGLAEDGFIKDIRPGRYTTSLDNKRYALTALELLRLDESLASDPKELWRRVMKGVTKQHNSQMNVVIALWNARKFVMQ
jgi:hypothetical protein